MANPLMQFLTWALVWGLVFGILFFLVNWMTKGLLGSILQVRGSRGKKVLVRVYGATDIYFKTCLVQDGQILLKYRGHKERARIRYEKDALYNFIGVRCVDIDEATSSTVDQIRHESIEGHDPHNNESLIKRAMMRPPSKDNKIQTVLVLMIIVLLTNFIVLGVCVTVLRRITALGVIA